MDVQQVVVDRVAQQFGQVKTGLLAVFQTRVQADDPGAAPAGMAAAVIQAGGQGFFRCPEQLGRVLVDLAAGMQSDQVGQVAVPRLGLRDVFLPFQNPPVSTGFGLRQPLQHGAGRRCRFVLAPGLAAAVQVPGQELAQDLQVGFRCQAERRLDPIGRLVGVFRR